MPEIITSVLNKNSLLYGAKEIEKKNIGLSCVNMKGEKIDSLVTKLQESLIKVVREK